MKLQKIRKCIFPNIKTRLGCPLSPLPFNIVLENQSDKTEEKKGKLKASKVEKKKYNYLYSQIT